MRSAFVPTLVLALLPCLVAAQGPPDIRALEDALARGLTTRARSQLESLLAPDFVLRGQPDIDRETWLTNALSLCWGDRADIDGFAVRSMGDAMVATFVLTTYQDPTTCDRATLRSLITDLWQRGDGGWRLVLRQSGPVGGPGALGAQFAKEAPPPPRWSGRAEVSFVSTGGNTSTQSLGLGGALDYRPGPWLTTATVSLVRAETADAVTARSLTLDLRQARDVSPRLALFGHGAYLRDTFAGIEHRVGVDGGVGYKVLTTAPHALKVDVGVGYTSETRVAEADRSFAIATMTFRYVLALSGTTELTQDGSFTASLQETEDWRYANTVALSASLNSIISLKLSHALKHLNLPVTGFRKTDTIVAAALVARF